MTNSTNNRIWYLGTSDIFRDTKYMLCAVSLKDSSLLHAVTLCCSCEIISFELYLCKMLDEKLT